MIARGVVHCHTDLSYDCKVELGDLCDTLQHEGFQFVALTEHDRGVTPELYSDYVERCRRVSNSSFVAIPGLEIRCTNGSEIAGLGLEELVTSGAPQEVVDRIRVLGGYSILVHPWKLGRWRDPYPEADAIEVMNGKVDGTIAPNLGLLRSVRRARRSGLHSNVITGLDMHELSQPRATWVECRTALITQREILRSLREGGFLSHTAAGSLLSSGAMSAQTFCRMLGFRAAYRGWNGLLPRLPRLGRDVLMRLARTSIAQMKRPPANCSRAASTAD